MSRKPAGPSTFLVGGRHAVAGAARAGRLLRLWVTPRALAAFAAGAKLPPDVPTEELNPAALAAKFSGVVHQGLVGEVRAPAASTVEAIVAAAAADRAPVVALEEIQDPQNLGAVFRAAAALGAAGVVLTKHRRAPLSAAVARASAGTLWRVPWAEVGGFPNWLPNQPLPAVATVAEGGAAPWRVSLAPAVVAFGHEGRGLKPLTVARCGERLTIPTASGVDSLNVAQTVTAVLSEALRQRTAAQNVFD